MSAIIEIPEETSKSIEKMGRVSAGLAKLKEKYSKVPDCSTAEGYEKAKTEAREIAKVRIDVGKAHKAGKAFYLEGGRKIDSMKNEILSVVSPLEDARKEAVKAIDDEKKRVLQEAAEKEQARVDGIQRRLNEINGFSSLIEIEPIDYALNQIEAIDLHDFEEFKDAACSAIETTRNTLTERRAVLIRQREEAEKLEAQRAEQQRQQAEIDAKLKAIADAEAAEIERKKREAREAELAEQARKDKEEALKAAEEKRIADIEQARIEAAEAERLKVENERLRKEAEAQAEIDRLSRSSDSEKLRAWLKSLPELPELTAASDEIRRQVSSHIDQIHILIEAGE